MSSEAEESGTAAPVSKEGASDLGLDDSEEEELPAQADGDKQALAASKPPEDDLGLEDSDDDDDATGDGGTADKVTAGDQGEGTAGDPESVADLGLDDSDEEAEESEAPAKVDEGAEQPRKAAEEVDDGPIPRLTTRSLAHLDPRGDGLVVMRFPPNLVDVQPTPYDEDRYAEDVLDEKKVLRKLKDVVRWRYKKDEDGEVLLGPDGKAQRESNARIVTFENGERYLYVGSEAYSLASTGKHTKSDTNWITRSATVDGAALTSIQFVGAVVQSYNVKPTFKMRAGTKRKRTVDINITKTDYEKAQGEEARRDLRAMREKAKKAKAEKMRRERRHPRQEWGSYLETSDNEQDYARESRTTSGYEDDGFVVEDDYAQVGETVPPRLWPCAVRCG
uniref:RNA polymerase-associated protein LEO1 n=1 Tax=Pinguiococcus pyrenoidosus TaxID=172671 RepID=A0A7R9U470_9STRA